MMNNNTMRYVRPRQYINPKEKEIISRLSYEKASIIAREKIQQWFKYPKTTLDKTISRLIKKGILKVIKKGVYFYSPLDSGPAGSNINEFLIPPILFPKGNYYIGYTNMFNYYGLLEQISQTMYILNTSLQKQKYIGNILFKLVKVSPNRMYGINEITIKNSKVKVSDREKTIIDMIYFPDPVGGLKAAFDLLCEQINRNKIDVKILVKYALLFPSISIRKRIGFILDKCKISNNILDPLVKSVRNTSLITLYGSKSRKGEINNKWKVIIDAAQK
ncbi:MAG: hypothetical protein KKA19_09215 [Candidatus Margulisbacteria bacterium]|nr:hypothetical protein [Candidatus Margulisiibacteriota bacterium]